MQFAKRLREGVRLGRITCTVRIWKSLRVRVGGRYRMDEGEVEVDSIERIGLPDINPQLARDSGFAGILDLLKVAKHGNRRSDLPDPLSLHSSPETAQSNRDL